MIKISFKADSNYETKNIGYLMGGFKPKVDFKLIENTPFGTVINTTFKNEIEKNDFVNSLSDAINLSEDGTYVK